MVSLPRPGTLATKQTRAPSCGPVIDRGLWTSSCHNYMNIQRENRPAPFDVFDFEKRLGQGSTDSTPLFVDVGGAMGAQCVAFRQRHPNLPGRVILQDQPEVVDQVKASPLPGFETVDARLRRYRSFPCCAVL
ncbi:hypothetical protein F5Y15DRAFT_402418 [Xylariaceae sp. FL0016]|nr:hypothetical protein F5Y15DRAFT_402418 [Xylariaceae sp. FL0016]